MVIFNSYVKLPEGILYIRMYVGHPSRNGNPSSEYIEYLTPFTIFKSISMDQWPVAQIALHSLAEKRAPHPSLQPSLQPLESTRLRQTYPNVCTLRTLLVLVLKIYVFGRPHLPRLQDMSRQTLARQGMAKRGKVAKVLHWRELLRAKQGNSNNSPAIFWSEHQSAS